MTAIGRLCWTAIDCPDARALGAFYAAITDWPIDEDRSDDEWVHLAAEGPVTVCFQQVDDYRPPQWPGQEHPQQEHLDFYVDDLDGAEEQVIALGARKHAVQPGRDFRVYLDPADHPFCLIQAGSE
jgi:predicted enzyme related to lactoylglutathione lyase